MYERRASLPSFGWLLVYQPLSDSLRRLRPFYLWMRSRGSESEAVCERAWYPGRPCSPGLKVSWGLKALAADGKGRAYHRKGLSEF